MPDDRITERNRTNARKSTGPRTAQGKAITSRNAVRHGVLSLTPVIPDLEHPAAWEEHRARILDALQPDGGLELALAERIALALWRLTRLARAEQATVALDQLDVGERLDRLATHGQPTLLDAHARLETQRALVRLLERLSSISDQELLNEETAWSVLNAAGGVAGVDDVDELRYPFVPRDTFVSDFEGWTAALLRQALAVVAEAAGTAADALLTHVLSAERKRAIAAKALLDGVERRLQLMRLARLVPEARAAESFARYEAHLSRQWTQALHELERLQSTRAGRPVVPPIVVDVTVDRPEDAGAND